jgi:hypothetical protein
MRTERVVSRFVANGFGRHIRVNIPAMDKYTQCVDRSDCSSADEPAFVAETIQADFIDLLDIFDTQLAGLSDADGVMRSHIAEARSAAARGLQLSRQLIEILSASN